MLIESRAVSASSLKRQIHIYSLINSLRCFERWSFIAAGVAVAEISALYSRKIAPKRALYFATHRRAPQGQALSGRTSKL